jgi:divinyl protochlorophyllide a 8-vinyl-reductase
MILPSSPGSALIGPNAILQTLGVLDRVEGSALRGAVMAQAGVAVPPADSGMLPEEDCAAVHHALRSLLPSRADALLHASGLATGDYILRHRIPRAAQTLLRLVPGAWGAPILARAIARHAWTFAGSGQFRVASTRPLVFELSDNPLIKGAHADLPMCHWHTGVFERLFSRLIWPEVRVTETDCAATGGLSCRFEILPWSVPA